jgi:hypothetical protein
MLAAIDVEWSKNYRIHGGNVPFCYSVTWLTLPRTDANLDELPFWYISAYVQDASETSKLVASADQTLTGILEHGELIAGHQLSSDLAVLASAARSPAPGVAAAQDAWRARRQERPAAQCIIDTRYDTSHVLTCASRRLVDVCADLRLDVRQPELRGTSMTALHRRWTETGDVAAREKISVLNLRHALSTALVAARAGGLGSWEPGLNINRLLAAGLDGAFDWLADPTFLALLREHGAA